MDLRPDLQLQSIIKSMTDVILPAVDPANRMALEQAQLVLGMLHLLALRLPMQFHYDCDALQRYLDLSTTLQGEIRGGVETTAAQAALGHEVIDAAKLSAGAKSSPAALEASLTHMRNAIGALVRAVWVDGEPGCRAPVGRAVLAASRAQIERERSWFAPQAWDDGVGFTPIETLIHYPAGIAVDSPAPSHPGRHPDDST